MLRLRGAAALLAASLAQSSADAAPADAQYPTKPIRLLIPFPPGGGNDLLGRAFAERLGQRLGQPMIVDNRAGASTAIAADITARAPADGHTLLLATVATLAVLPGFRVNLPYDPVRDFDPVSQISTSPYLLVVNPGVPARSVKELVALAKSRPGQLNYASPGHGTMNHLAFELFKIAAGVDLTHVPYKGTGPALADLLGGHVSVMFASTSSARPLVLADKLRALGISTLRRSPAVPEVAPVAESGVPGFDASSWGGLVAPRGTPASVIARLNAEIATVVQQGDLRENLEAQGYVLKSGTPQEFAALIHSELARFRKLIRTTGLRVE